MNIQLQSQNKYFLDILFKNPNTDLGLYLKPLRNGVIVGNCKNEHQYEIVFQDTKYSFLQDDTQLDFQSYCNPNVVLHIVSEFFSHLLIDKETYWDKEISWLCKTYQDIDNQSIKIDLPNIYLDSNWYNERGFLLSKYLPQVKMQHKIGYNYSLSIEAKNVFEGINLLALVACFIEITNNFKSPWLSEDWFVKYVRILTNIENVPYFVFYLFIKRCLKSPKVFETLKPKLESYFKNDEVKFVFTDTHGTRKEHVFKELGLTLPVLDFGCGELQYYKLFRGKGLKQNYYAVDREVESVLPIVEKYQKQGGENLYFSEKLEDFSDVGKVNIILSEVIEHNSIEVTKSIFEQIKKFDFNKIVITTPNREFNQYYSMDKEFRREDHIYEMDASEFKDLIINTFGGNFNVQISQIGDSINEVSPTQMAVIEKKC